MGLDFTWEKRSKEETARWSYSGFNAFRRKLAEETGRTLETFWERGEADKPIDDDIEPLLNHSDCDGILTPQECRKVAPRLRALIANWDDEDYNKMQGLRLAENMESAADKEVPLEFT